MKKVRKGILFVLGLGFTVGLVAQLAAAPSIMRVYPGRIDLLSYDPVSRQVDVKVTVRSEFQLPGLACNGLVTVRVDTLDGVIYTGPDRYEVQVDQTAPAVLNLEVIVPANDTSGFRLRTECGDIHESFGAYFVTSGDSIRLLSNNPRHWIPLGAPASVEEQNRAMAEELKRLWEEKQSQEKPDPQSAMKITTRRTIEPIKPCDSALFDSLSDLGQRRLLSMRGRERDAYEGSARQLYEVEGRWWVRERGEREFRRLEPQTDEELREEARQLWDSLGTKSPDDSCTAYVYVESPDDEAFARSLIDSLSPTDQPGVYRVHTTHRVLEQLRAQGIRYRFNLRPPHDRRDSRTTPSEED